MDAACHLTPIQNKKKRKEKALVMPWLFTSQVVFFFYFPHSVAVRAGLVRVGR